MSSPLAFGPRLAHDAPLLTLFDIAYTLGGALLAPVWSRKLRGGWDERFGKIEPLPAKRTGVPRIMVHAVSVGEVNAARGLVRLLVEGGAEVLVTSTTDTGIARALAVMPSLGLTDRPVFVRRYPLDFSWAVRRFHRATQVDAVALVELEVWPNFVRASTRRGVPVAVINGRLSARSFEGYRRIRPLIGPSFARLAFVAAQDEAYRQRFLSMGARPESCTVAGNVKWDAVSPGLGSGHVSAAALELARGLGIDRSKPLIVAGSTAEGEEALLHACCPPGVQLLCAPRKPERFDAAASDLPGCIRRSSVLKAAEPSRNSNPAEVPLGSPSVPSRFLLDTLGELSLAYQLADLVVIGRTFTRPGARSLGGSDPMEPAALGKPIICGHDVRNFESAVAALRAGGGLVQLDETVSEQLTTKLGATLGELAASPERRESMRMANHQTVESHRGATERQARMVLGLVGVTRRP